MGGILELETRRRRKRGSGIGKFILFLTFLLLVITLSVLFYINNWPNTAVISPYADQPQPIWVDRTLWQGKGTYVKDGKVWLPYSFLREKIDSYIYWDEAIESLIITTKDQVIRLPNRQLTAFLNEKPFSLSFPVEKVDGEPFLPLEMAERIYPYQFSYHPETGVLVVKSFGSAWQTAVVNEEAGKGKEAPLRSGPSIKDPLYLSLNPGERVEVLAEEKGWYKVRTEKGIVGFMDKRELSLGDLVTVNAPKQDSAAFTPWKPLGKPILLTWEHVVRKTPDPNQIGELRGVNVVSPTWFEIVDEKGTVKNKADLNYVKWAHDRGYKVWGLISNGFNPDRTSAFLASFETRQAILRQMLQLANLYQLDGFNIDFENVYLKDREKLVQFVREITPYLHEMGLTVSMDVTVKSESETWSKFYDRKALGETVDYIAVMTYDEHYAGSAVAGSVASLPWVEEGLKGILEEVPAEKVLLGVPFYTRLWSESVDSNGKVVVKQKALSMDQANQWMAERNLTYVLDPASGQNYVEYKDAGSGILYKMWLEDTTSMQKRAELVKKYGLAGMAAWRRGFETPEIWNTIAEAWAR